MEELLLQHGYKLTKGTNEWSRNNWTIRYDKEILEAFNNPDETTKGIYYSGPINKIDLQELLSEINSYLLSL